MHQADWHITKMGCHMLGEALKHLEGRLEQSISLEVLERDCRNSVAVAALLSVMRRLNLLLCTSQCWYLMEKQPEDNVKMSYRRRLTVLRKCTNGLL